MTTHDERYQRIAQAVFGPDASLHGTMGGNHHGELAIHVGDRVLGRGPTFQAALADSMVAAAAMCGPAEDERA